MSNSALRKAYFSAAKAIDTVNLSFQTTSDYKRIVHHALKTLNGYGFKLHSITQLKQKHVDKLIDSWKQESLSVGTIKNRLSVLRKVTEATGREQVIKSNLDYQVGSRQYVSTISKGIYDIDLKLIPDPYLRASLLLQKEFGLRREEAIKFKPHQADKGNLLELQASWTKGGIPRSVPIISKSQRECLDQIKKIVKKGQSLIPEGKTYKQQKNNYNYLTHKNGLRNLHGLRHAYAQQRYESLTHQLTNGHGWKSPIQGGPKKTELNPFEKNIDNRARLMISQEMGHSRIAIVRSYLN